MKQEASRISFFMLAFRLVYYSTLKMEVTYSSETPGGFHLTTWRYIPE
jgi:hypothetical protein